MRVLDLFSGIGGFSLGLERAGMETVAFCEIEPFCQKVLRKHWPDVPIYDDIKELTNERLQADGITADIITGGYPCQPFSNAGQRQGKADDRHLWPEMYRLIKAIRPRWVIAENVAGHISLGLDAVLSDLEAIRFTCWVFVIPACAKDSPQLRDRVWIVAHTKGKQGASENIEQQSKKTSVPKKVEPGGGYRWDVRPRNWEREPAICRVVDGVPGQLDRNRATGNAVVPQIPEIIGRAIMEQEQAS